MGTDDNITVAPLLLRFMYMYVVFRVRWCLCFYDLGLDLYPVFNLYIIMACPIDVDTRIERHALKSRVIREEYNTRYFGYLLGNQYLVRVCAVRSQDPHPCRDAERCMQVTCKKKGIPFLILPA